MIPTSLKMCLCAGAVGALSVPAVHHTISHLRHHHVRPARARTAPVPCTPSTPAFASLSAPASGIPPLGQQQDVYSLPTAGEIGRSAGSLPNAYSPRTPFGGGGIGNAGLPGGGGSSANGGGGPGTSIPIPIPTHTPVSTPLPVPVPIQGLPAGSVPVSIPGLPPSPVLGPIPGLPPAPIPAPEPGTATLFGLGLAAILKRRRTR